MIEAGCKRPAMVTYNSPRFFTCRNVSEDMPRHLKNGGYRCPEKSWLKKVDIPQPKAAIEKAMQELLSADEPVDAILFGSNSIAIHGVKYINSLPLKVPRDLSIISLMKPNRWTCFMRPLLTSRQPMREMGQLVTKILLDTMEKNNKVTQQVNMQAELVIRASTRQKLSKKVLPALHTTKAVII